MKLEIASAMQLQMTKNTVETIQEDKGDVNLELYDWLRHDHVLIFKTKSVGDRFAD